MAAGFKCERCKETYELDAMGPEVTHVNWDHHPLRRENSIDFWVDRPWDMVSQWAVRGNIGRTIDELQNVRMLHRGCHTL